MSEFLDHLLLILKCLLTLSSLPISYLCLIITEFIFNILFPSSLILCFSSDNLHTNRHWAPFQNIHLAFIFTFHFVVLSVYVPFEHFFSTNDILLLTMFRSFIHSIMFDTIYIYKLIVVFFT